MNNPFNLIIFVFYLILGVLFTVHYVRVKIKYNSIMNKSVPTKKYLDLSKGAALCAIRNQYFPVDYMNHRDFFINDYMEEAFNIFLKLSPSMISTLTKADRRLITFKSMIDNDMMTEADLKIEIENIDKLLDTFVQVSHQMIEKLEEVINNPHLDMSSSQLSSSAIEAYMASVNVLIELTDNHSDINYEIHYKLSKKYPDLVEPFRIIAGKITYLLFINLISYSNKIDENIFIYE